MKTFCTIIDTFGVPVVATILGLDESHVRTMKARDSIPAEYWGALLEEASRKNIRGLTWKTFKELRERRFKERAAS